MNDEEKIINYRKNSRGAFKWWLYALIGFAILLFFQASDSSTDLGIFIVIDVLLGILFFVIAVIYSIAATISGPIEILDKRYKDLLNDLQNQTAFYKGKSTELTQQIESLIREAGVSDKEVNEDALRELTKQIQDYKDEALQSRYTIENLSSSLETSRGGYNKVLGDLKSQLKDAQSTAVVANSEASLWKQTLLEKSAGFPSLLSNISYFEELKDASLSGYLIRKPHPAAKASELVKEESERRRRAEFDLRKTKAVIDYYENIAPFLLDFKDQLVEDDGAVFEEYSPEESEDPVTKYLTKEEYRKLSPVEKNTLALKRFWDRPKSKWLIGRLYERYVGYIYEIQGYDVDYMGIFHGYEDLGRDLICSKGKNVVIIQCKCWSQFKTIYEKHIFQFFGTVFEYKDKYRDKIVTAKFYTSTRVSDLARRFAQELNIELIENFKLKNEYPCIKCNISRVDGSKIYHLPFDQQYDNTKIEPKNGEFYCENVLDAENAGFRRAFKWRGAKSE